MKDEFVTVTLTVQKSKVSALYKAAAELSASDDDIEEVGWDDEEAPRRRARKGFGAGAVKKAYLGGQSDYWRPFLEELAQHADHWVAWDSLCEAIGLENRQAAGMLGAAERRCKGRPPYEKKHSQDQYWFSMTQEVAAVVLDLAEERRE